jgi:glutamine amidotransferase-like uncharacterized protein
MLRFRKINFHLITSVFLLNILTAPSGANFLSSLENNYLGPRTVWAGESPPTLTTPTATNSENSGDALIYAGEATAFGDAESIERILSGHQVSYRKVTSAEMNAMTLEELKKFKVIIWPGGYAGQMSESLETSTRERIRSVVNEHGVSYVGICAGAFIAVSPAPSANEAGPRWGLSLITLPEDPESLLPYYYLEEQGIEEAMVEVELANQPNQSWVWWGGPYLPEVPEGVVARYKKTGQPAVIQTWANKGFVVLAGPHPEAPEDWRTKLGLADSDGLDHDLAWQMFEAALYQKPMVTLPTKS